MFAVLRRLKPTDYACMVGCAAVSVVTLNYIKTDLEKTNKIIREKNLQKENK